MPSWISSVPIREASELASLSTQRGKQSFITSSSIKTEDEVEFKLDFRGHKHVATSENSDLTYTLQDDQFSSYTTFTMPGHATANALRHYLQEHLKPHQIMDEYGEHCDLACISNNHLSVLQAKMWSRVSKGRSPMKTTTSQPSRTQALVADHVTKIMRRLEEKHLFVLSNTGSNTCHYLNDLRKTIDHICTSQIIVLEPLVHWGTVTPAIVSQAMITFRRDGGLMQIPAYKHLVERSIDPKAPSYCVDCLQYLWGKHEEAQSITRQLVSNELHLQSPDSSWKNKTGTLQLVNNLSSTGFGAVTADVGRMARPTAYQTKPVDPKMYENIGTISQGPPSSNAQIKPVKLQASFQLDGTSDLGVAPSPSWSYDHQGHTSTRKGVNSEENFNERIDFINPSLCSNSPVHPLRTAPVMLKESGGSSAFTGQQALKEAPNSTSTQTTNTVKNKSHSSCNFVKNKYGFRVKVQTASLCCKERKFGRELDTNSTAPPIHAKKSSQMKQAPAVENDPSKVLLQSMKLIKPLRSPKKLNNPLKPTKRKSFTRDDHTIKQKKIHVTGSGEHKSTPPDHQINYTAGLRSTLELHPTSPPLSPPKLTAHFAKRSINSDVLEDVVTLTYEAFQNTHPSPTSKICVCNKSALHGTFKKGEIPQISQCVNRDCRFRWYHYSCLNQSEKGKARWGTLVCQHCRNEEEFIEQYKDGCNAMQQMDFETTWVKEDVEAGMPGLGGHRPVANPYGLGVEIDLRPLHRLEAHSKDKLGQLEAFGYAKSRPHMLQEAYNKPNTYADLRDITIEDEADDDQWWHRTHTIEECYSDGEESLDLDTEDKLEGRQYKHTVI